MAPLQEIVAHTPRHRASYRSLLHHSGSQKSMYICFKAQATQYLTRLRILQQGGHLWRRRRSRTMSQPQPFPTPQTSRRVRVPPPLRRGPGRQKTNLQSHPHITPIVNQLQCFLRGGVSMWRGEFSSNEENADQLPPRLNQIQSLPIFQPLLRVKPLLYQPQSW